MTPEEFIVMVEKLLKRVAEPKTRVRFVHVYTHDETYHIRKEGIARYHDEKPSV